MHLYVHIPFCHRICPYCSFHKHTPANTDIKGFVDALLIEARSRVRENNRVLSTIYFGGGTPSMLSDRHLGKLFDGLKDIFDWNQIKEVTFEANPATFNQKRARFFHDLGISRMSLGIQSWDQDILGLLGREHSPEQAEQSILLLREAEIPEINVDLMFSLPGQSLETWKKTLEKTISLSPEHISAYNLSYEEDTEFLEYLNAGKWDVDEDRDAEYFELSHTLLSQAGYRHYETSNYARDGFLSHHNLSYWMGEDYLGIGPGAVGTVNRTRYANRKDTNAYIAQTLETGLPDFEEEFLSEEDFRHERIALLLRTDTGLPATWLSEDKTAFLNDLSTEGLGELTDGRVILSDKGRLLVDEIALALY